MTLPTGAKSVLARLTAGLDASGLKITDRTFRGRRERWCDFSVWKDAMAMPVTLSACVWPYLGGKHSFWVGFSSKDKAPIRRLADAHMAANEVPLPELRSRHWTDSMMLKPAQRREVKASGGLAVEDYVPSGLYVWFGLYLPLDSDTADNAYRFLTQAMAMHRGAARPVKDGPTERLARRRERITQGAFRNRQLKVWGFRCAVTGCAVETLLQASHITPWAADAEVRNSNGNGILLVPTLHKLFDDGHISFRDDGRILISGDIMPTERANLGLHDDMRVPDGFDPEQVKHMAEHRRRHGFLK